jgi:hypothetical protein
LLYNLILILGTTFLTVFEIVSGFQVLSLPEENHFTIIKTSSIKATQNSK